MDALKRYISEKWPLTVRGTPLESVSEADRLIALPRPYTEQEGHSFVAADPILQLMSREQLEKSIAQTRKLMQEAAKKLEFIQAAQYRDEVLRLEELLKEK